MEPVIDHGIEKSRRLLVRMYLDEPAYDGQDFAAHRLGILVPKRRD
jgi:hypothetical protein